MVDPVSLRTDASLNRTCLAALRDAEPDWVGRPAYTLLSRDALLPLAQDLPEATAARVFGRRLGHLIATLHLDGDVDEIRTEWRQAYRAYWRTIQQVWLGGGLAARLGDGLVSSARAEANRLGAAAVSIELGPFPACLPLIGAARSISGDRKHAVVLDFGHTTIKRALATYRDQTLVRLELFEPKPAPPPDEVIENSIDVVADTLALAPEKVDPNVIVGVASYVLPTGELEDSNSLYAPLRLLAPAVLTERVRRRSRKPIERIRFAHDGTLAGSGVLMPRSNAAVIMLGTALGVGFVQSGQALRPVAPDLDVHSA